MEDQNGNGMLVGKAGIGLTNFFPDTGIEEFNGIGDLPPEPLPGGRRARCPAPAGSNSKG